MGNVNHWNPPQQSRPVDNSAKLWMIGADLTPVDCSARCNPHTGTGTPFEVGTDGPQQGISAI